MFDSKFAQDIELLGRLIVTNPDVFQDAMHVKAMRRFFRLAVVLHCFFVVDHVVWVHVLDVDLVHAVYSSLTWSWEGCALSFSVWTRAILVRYFCMRLVLLTASTLTALWFDPRSLETRVFDGV